MNLDDVDISTPCNANNGAARLFAQPNCSRALFLFSDPLSRCMDDRLTPFYPKAFEFNAQITRPTAAEPTQRYFETRHPLVPYVGNGYFGVGVARSEPVRVKYGRHLSQPVNFHPIVEFESGGDGHESGSPEAKGSQANVVDFVNGVVHRFQCFGSKYSVSSDFYGEKNGAKNGRK